MIDNPLNKNSETLFRSELDQAWSHYRHLEETRTKYLNFFFTIFLASIGFILTLITGLKSSISIDLYFGFAVFILALFLFSVILLASIVRLGYVLSSYELVMSETRKYFHGIDSPVLEIWNIRKNIPESVNRGVFSIQKSSRLLVLGVCMILSIIEFSLAYQIFNITNSLTSGYFLSALLSGFAMVLILLYIVRAIKQADDQKKLNKANSADTKSRAAD
jgi:hypothetical protein